jgi:signal peptidase I
LIAEGFTYRFRHPRRGEIVNFHIRGRIGEPVAPDPNGNDFIAKRVIGVPGDRVAWQNSRVLVNGHRADDIPTPEFAPVRLGNDEYFVIGDNRSYSQDSRDFGPVPRKAIFSRVILVWWPSAASAPSGTTRSSRRPGLCLATDLLSQSPSRPPLYAKGVEPVPREPMGDECDLPSGHSGHGYGAFVEPSGRNQWQPAGATSGNQRQIAGRRKPQKQAESVAMRCDPLPETSLILQAPVCARPSAARTRNAQALRPPRDHSSPAGVLVTAAAMAALAWSAVGSSPIVAVGVPLADLSVSPVKERL